MCLTSRDSHVYVSDNCIDVEMVANIRSFKPLNIIKALTVCEFLMLKWWKPIFKCVCNNKTKITKLIFAIVI